MSDEPFGVLRRLREAISSVFLGKREVVDSALVALLARGHLLIEDVPGVGKTLLARSVARSLDCRFRRIQFTPDLLPSDILGSNIFDARTNEFHFEPGPIFTNVLLADEINRTSPRTQSALLEAMNEGSVTIDGVTRSLDAPFLVLATQNPHEFEGAYPLPESQLDRFLLRLTIGHPSREHEKRLLASHRGGEPVDTLESVVDTQAVLELQRAVAEVTVDDAIEDYLLDLVAATRTHPEVEVGASVRGALMLYRAAQALAMLGERRYAVPDDVKQMAAPVLAHRLILRSGRRQGAVDAATGVVEEILDATPVPQ